MGRHQCCLTRGVLGLGWGRWGTPRQGRVEELLLVFSFLTSFSFSSIQMPHAGQVSVPTPAIHQYIQSPDPHLCHLWDLGHPIGSQGPCVPGRRL